MRNPATTRQPIVDPGKSALVSLIGGMGFAVLLSLVWLALVWLNGTSQHHRLHHSSVILSGVEGPMHCHAAAPLPQGLLTMIAAVPREFPESSVEGSRSAEVLRLRRMIRKRIIQLRSG